MVSLLLAALWVGKMAPAQLWAGRWTQGCPKSERSWPLFLNFLEQSFSGSALIRNRLQNRLHLGSQRCKEKEQLLQALLRHCDDRCAGGGHPTSVCTKCHGQAGNPQLFRQCFLACKGKPVSGTTVPAVFLNCRLVWRPVFSSEAHVSRVHHSQQHNLPTIPPLLKPVYLGQCIWGFFQGCLPTDVPNRHRSSP